MWREIGYCVCHQISDRTPEIGGCLLPACARCAGLYLGFVLSCLLQIVFAKGRRRSGFPPIWVVVVAVLGLGAMAVDGVTSYAGWRETTNLIRLVTGSLAGSAVAVVLYPLVNYVLWPGRDPKRVIPGWQPLYLVILWALGAVLLLMVAQDLPVWVGVVVAAAICLGIVGMWTAINAVLLGVVLQWNAASERTLSPLWILLLALVAVIVELTMAHLLHTWLYRAVGLL